MPKPSLAPKSWLRVQETLVQLSVRELKWLAQDLKVRTASRVVYQLPSNLFVTLLCAKNCARCFSNSLPDTTTYTSNWDPESWQLKGTVLKTGRYKSLILISALFVSHFGKCGIHQTAQASRNGACGISLRRNWVHSWILVDFNGSF